MRTLIVAAAATVLFAGTALAQMSSPNQSGGTTSNPSATGSTTSSTGSQNSTKTMNRDRNPQQSQAPGAARDRKTNDKTMNQRMKGSDSMGGTTGTTGSTGTSGATH